MRPSDYLPLAICASAYPGTTNPVGGPIPCYRGRITEGEELGFGVLWRLYNVNDPGAPSELGEARTRTTPNLMDGPGSNLHRFFEIECRAGTPHAAESMAEDIVAYLQSAGTMSHLLMEEDSPDNTSQQRGHYHAFVVVVGLHGTIPVESAVSALFDFLIKFREPAFTELWDEQPSRVQDEVTYFAGGGLLEGNRAAKRERYARAGTGKVHDWLRGLSKMDADAVWRAMPDLFAEIIATTWFEYNKDGQPTSAYFRSSHGFFLSFHAYGTKIRSDSLNEDGDFYDDDITPSLDVEYRVNEGPWRGAIIIRVITRPSTSTDEHVENDIDFWHVTGEIDESILPVGTIFDVRVRYVPETHWTEDRFIVEVS